MKRVIGCGPWSIALALIMLGGCSGSQPNVPSNLPKLASGAALTHMPSANRAPAIRKKGPLLYVSDGGDDFLYVFSLPAGRLVQKITGFQEIDGLCSDKKGNVFVADLEAQSIKEYAHGGNEPIAVLDDPEAFPIGCSADPMSGNLAVANNFTVDSTDKVKPANIAVYTNERGKPKVYTDPSLYSINSDCYDSSGNLYVSGAAQSSAVSNFAILYKGAHKPTDITLNQSFSNFAPLQWDGQDLAVASDTNKIYRFSITGTTGTKVGTTKLARLSSVGDFWIQNNEIYAPGYLNRQPMVKFYPYPSGGRATKSLLGFAEVFGATVSILP